MRARSVRLVPAAAAAWAAAGIATTLPDVSGAIAAALWCVAIVATAAAARRAGPAWTLVAVAAALAAAAASHVALALPQRAAVAELALGGGRAVVVHAVVVGKAETTARGDISFDAVAYAVDVGAQRHPVDVPIVVRGHERPDIGAQVEVAGTATQARPGRRAVLVVRAAGEIRITRPAGGAFAVAAGMRAALAQATKGLPEPAAGLIPGLAVGDTAGVSAELDAAMKASSLSHLTAVSGANCAIVVGLAFAGAALCGARRGIRVAAAVAALAGFVLLVTPEPSVVRAAAMAGLAMLAVLLGRRSAGVALLSVAVVASLIADPWLATSMGFGLSAAATAALLLLAGPLAQGMHRFLPRAVALGLAVPLAAQLACGPLLILINPTVPLYGVLANLLAAPAAPVATVLGLAACMVAPIPPLAAGLVALTWVPAAWISGTALTAVALPAAAVPWPEGGWGAAALTALGVAVAILLLPRRPGRAARWARRAAAAAVAGTLGVGVGQSALGTIAEPLTSPAEWAIAACDVGQGDALLVRSAGAVALIDTGPAPGPLAACLDRFRVDRVALLVLTHYDLDHVGGTDAVADRSGLVLHGPPARDSDTRLLHRVAATGARVQDAFAGLRGDLGDARWSVLWPRAGDRVFTSGNQACVVLDVRGGGVPPALFLGDLDALSQRALLASGALSPPYAVVKVAHHGSADQSADLYRVLGGAVAVISVGAHNDYGHPREATLTLLRANGFTILRTDRDGALVLAAGSDGGVRIRRDRSPP